MQDNLTSYQKEKIKEEEEKIANSYTKIVKLNEEIKHDIHLLEEDYDPKYAEDIIVKIENIKSEKLDIRTYRDNIEQIKEFSLTDLQDKTLKLAKKNMKLLQQIIKDLETVNYEGHEEFLRCYYPNLIQQQMNMDRLVQ